MIREYSAWLVGFLDVVGDSLPGSTWFPFFFFRMMAIVGRVDVLRLGEFSFDADTRRYAKYIFQFGVTWR